MHTISFLAKVRVMPSKYDPELRSKAVGLAEHRDDYPSKFDALTAAEFPDSDPPDAEYFCCSARTTDGGSFALCHA